MSDMKRVDEVVSNQNEQIEERDRIINNLKNRYYAAKTREEQKDQRIEELEKDNERLENLVQSLTEKNRSLGDQE